MMNSQWHLTSEELDRMRAGLPDDASLTAARVRTHLAVCPNCRQKAEFWDRVAARLDAQAHGDPELSRRLGENRRSILAGRPPWRRIVTRRGLAAAAVLILAVAGGLLAQHQRAAPTPTVAQARSTTPENTPDFYRDIDFYVWLANQKLRTGSAHRHET